MNPVIRTIFAVATAALLLAGCNNAPASAVKGEQMPEFTITSLDGKAISNSELFRDKVVIFNAMASWCGPCGEEMPDLVRLSEILPKDKFVVASISVDTDRAKLEAFMAKYGVKFPMFWDQGGFDVVTPILHSRAFPETFILNRDGVFLEMIPGAFPWASPGSVAILKQIYETGKIPGPSKHPSSGV